MFQQICYKTDSSPIDAWKILATRLQPLENYSGPSESYSYLLFVIIRFLVNKMLSDWNMMFGSLQRGPLPTAWMKIWPQAQSWKKLHVLCAALVDIFSWMEDISAGKSRTFCQWRGNNKSIEDWGIHIEESILKNLYIGLMVIYFLVEVSVLPERRSMWK